jgi:hypothetical protein
MPATRAQTVSPPMRPSPDQATIPRANAEELDAGLCAETGSASTSAVISVSSITVSSDAHTEALGAVRAAHPRLAATYRASDERRTKGAPRPARYPLGRG